MLKENITSVEMYTIPNCRYCIKAKELLERLEVENVTIHTLGQNDVTRDTLQEHIDREVPEHGKVRTVPQIFVNNNYVGGYTELAALVQV